MIAVTAYRLPSSWCETELIEMIFRGVLSLEAREEERFIASKQRRAASRVRNSVLAPPPE